MAASAAGSERWTIAFNIPYLHTADHEADDWSHAADCRQSEGT